MDPIRVLIVDDHSVVRRGLCAILESEPDIELVGEAADGAEAVEKAQRLSPDVVLMDLVMPGVDGITAIRQIRDSCPNTRILVLTSFGEDDKVFASIKAGAIGYLLKNTPAEDLERAIHSVARGELHLQAIIAERVLDEFSQKSVEKINLAKLTEREMDVLAMIARSLTNKEIAAELSISIRTVKVHVSNILNKLHSRDRTEAALYAIQRGLIADREPRQHHLP
jgi:two-component system, NarL family, response regulator LiaR